MPRTAPRLAKLSRPRLHGAVPRERLFRRLDNLQSLAVTVVAAPPGAGKTALVASYLESRKLGGLWFQMDAGDRDPSTFFYYLGLAASSASAKARRRDRLPLLTPEYMADLPGFARRYFRELFRQLAPPAAIVFDNFQEAGEDGPLHEMLSAALEEVPSGVRVFLISRHPPPDRYVRLAANRTLGLVEWDEIRLTDDEVSQLLGTLNLTLPPETTRHLLELSGGWAAGLLLLAEQLRRGRQLAAATSSDSLGQVFAYFAGQCFDDFDPAERRMLVQMSYLPALSESLAGEVTGSPAAIRLLEQLYRRHLFTELRNTGEARYVFHALFRTFLQHRAQTELTDKDRNAIAQRAGRLLQAGNEPQEAMSLYVSAEDYTAAESLVRAVAASLIGQGRWKVVVDWIEALPPTQVRGSPWLTYWLGFAWSGVDPVRARTDFERAHALALQAGDDECAVLSAAGMIDSYFLEYVEFVPLTPWIAEVDRMFSPGFQFSDIESELRAHSAMLVGCTYRAPDHRHLERCAQRVGDLIATATAIDVNLRVSAGTHLMLYGAFTVHLDAALRASILTVPLLSDPAVHLFRRMFGWAVACWYATCASDQALGGRALEALMGMAREDGMHIAERFACILGYYLDMDRPDRDAGMRRLTRFEEILIPSQPYEVASLWNMKAWQGLYTGDVSLARRHASEAARLFDAAGSIPHSINAHIAYLWGSFETGDSEGMAVARHALEELTASRNMAWGRWGLDAADAMTALRAGNEDDLRAMLERLFAQRWDRTDYYAHQFSWCTTWASELAVAALKREVCPDNVQHFVRVFRLPAPDLTVTRWPWPVHIATLGRFEVRVDGVPLGFAGRAPHRTLLLLKVLVALGGVDVKDYLVIDALWPDDEGDVARDAFRVALHRLRRLMVHPDTILVEDGHISLNPAVCWVDTLAFERALDRDDNADLALQIYRGDFLPSEASEGWSAACRERLKRRFLRKVQEVGDHHERQRRHREAAALYARVLDADPASETVAFRLMRCHHAEGDSSAALEVYRRLTNALQASSGTAPNEATQALYTQIRDTLGSNGRRGVTGQ
jgi:LuxR family maltose regulon positive regulatory protein